MEVLGLLHYFQKGFELAERGLKKRDDLTKAMPLSPGNCPVPANMGYKGQLSRPNLGDSSESQFQMGRNSSRGLFDFLVVVVFFFFSSSFF